MKIELVGHHDKVDNYKNNEALVPYVKNCKEILSVGANQ